MKTENKMFTSCIFWKQREMLLINISPILFWITEKNKLQTQEFAELIKIVCPSKSYWNILSSSHKNFVSLSAQIDKICFNQWKIIQDSGGE